MRVAIAEDSVLLREGLDAAARARPASRSSRSATTPTTCCSKVRSYAPDVAIVDIRLPPTHNDEGLRAALEIRAKHPSVGVLVLSQYVELGLAMKLLADSAEGVGYLLKDRISDVEDFVAAVRRVADGGSALDPIIVSTLLSRQRPDDPLGAADAPRARGARADGRGQLEPGDRRQARDHRSARSRSTSRASSASSACRRPAASRGACSPCCFPALLTQATADTRNPPLEAQVSRLPRRTLGCEVGRTPRERSRDEDACHPGRPGSRPATRSPDLALGADAAGD